MAARRCGERAGVVMFRPLLRDNKFVIQVHGGPTRDGEREWLLDSDEIWYAKVLGWGQEPSEFDATPGRAVDRLLASQRLRRSECLVREPVRD